MALTEPDGTGVDPSLSFSSGTTNLDKVDRRDPLERGSVASAGNIELLGDVKGECGREEPSSPLISTIVLLNFRIASWSIELSLILAALNSGSEGDTSSLGGNGGGAGVFLVSSYERALRIEEMGLGKVGEVGER